MIKSTFNEAPPGQTPSGADSMDDFTNGEFRDAPSYMAFLRISTS